MNSEYAAVQPWQDARARNEHAAWVATLSPEERQELVNLKIHKPDTAREIYPAVFQGDLGAPMAGAAEAAQRTDEADIFFEAARGKMSEGLVWALHFMADEPNPRLRGQRATAFLFYLGQLRIFPGCSTIAAVCRSQGVPEGSFEADLRKLRAQGRRF